MRRRTVGVGRTLGATFGVALNHVVVLDEGPEHRVGEPLAQERPIAQQPRLHTAVGDEQGAGVGDTRCCARLFKLCAASLERLFLGIRPDSTRSSGRTTSVIPG